MPSSNNPDGELLVGGQALIEGVMMRSPGAYGIAVRRPDGSLAIERGKVAPLSKRYPFLKLPVRRGDPVSVARRGHPRAQLLGCSSGGRGGVETTMDLPEAAARA